MVMKQLYGELEHNADGTVELCFKGHDLPDTAMKYYCYEEYGYIDIDILEKKEQRYYCTRWQNGEDAKENGFNHWIEVTNKVKKTYGKCTIIKIDYLET